MTVLLCWQVYCLLGVCKISVSNDHINVLPILNEASWIHKVPSTYQFHWLQIVGIMLLISATLCRRHSMGCAQISSCLHLYVSAVAAKTKLTSRAGHACFSIPCQAAAKGPPVSSISIILTASMPQSFKMQMLILLNDALYFYLNIYYLSSENVVFCAPALSTQQIQAVKRYGAQEAMQSYLMCAAEWMGHNCYHQKN